MLSQVCRDEFTNVWLPNITNQGLDRLIDLLEKDSPLLIHGSFTRAFPQGCLATHIGWHHPCTQHLTANAGIVWLTNIVAMNPATSSVIRSWDSCGPCAYEMRQELLYLLKEDRIRRQDKTLEGVEEPIPVEV